VTDSHHYLRLVRRRWKLLAVVAAIGAIAGYGSTVLSAEEDVPTTTYWSAKHVLVVALDGSSGRFPNLAQLALRVTGGEVPDAVAAELGGDPEELASHIRTMTLADVSAIEISAVDADPDRAAELADTFAGALLEFVSAEEVAAYDRDLAAAATDVQAAKEALDGYEAEVARLEREVAAADEVAGTAATRELNRLEVQRDAAHLDYEDALAAQSTLELNGPPASSLQSLDVVPPFVISEAEHGARLSQGRKGENNFTGDDVPEAKGSSAGVGSRLGSPPVRGVLGGLAALLGAVGFVLMRARLDPRLRSRREVEDVLGTPVLAEIARQRRRRPGLAVVDHPRSAAAEAYRMVRSALLVGGDGDAGGAPASGDGAAEARVVMVTSPGASEGKTTTAANLAIVLAEAGYEVLVVNCDFRRPRLHTLFGLPHAPREALASGIPGVTVVADVADASMRNPTHVVAAQRLLIARARQRYDVVVLDTAPLLATHDAASLLPSVDIVLLVAREAKTAREGAAEVRELLRRRRAPVAGVLLTFGTGFGESRYYQRYRYGTYYAEAVTARPPARPDQRAPAGTDGSSLTDYAPTSRRRRRRERTPLAVKRS
jgi:Mrp family chromosome partitioning ATPase